MVVTKKYDDLIVTPKHNDAIVVTPVYNETSEAFLAYEDRYSTSTHLNTFKFHIHKNTNFLQQSSYYSLQKYKINSENYQYLIQPRNFCKENPYLIILVPSIHTNKMVRDSIRRTWGSQEWPSGILNNVKLLFLFGVHLHKEIEFIIQEESEIFNDIIQGDYLDSYYNLTVKVLNGLRWVSNQCAGVKYVLKADEDTFTNIPLLLEFLQTSGMPETVYGHLHVDSNVKRVGKWAVSKSDFPFPTYPDYMAGNTYVISGDLLSKLVKTSEYVKYLHIEDVYITGILIRILKITHIDVEGFTQWYSSKPTVCDIINRYIITGNNIDSQYAQTIWNTLNNHSQTDCK
ncbi:hypothetical protein LOTGIDRAFT_130339 [Lottia gigantea]|uniref:Hexosyltransferase n=1 Tax=Lottia gigantea TaxID=225164 RepID=V4B9W9_LOTGI|nr:hypothetical protein LOTGIDRAFT_130339 [Lottia gigantea]ESO85824.1 hypothetical protein LOTGIDRAFT_130339 [Lottia gigantea]